MRGVAGKAGASFLGFVDVEEMQIDDAVSKACLVLSFSGYHELFVMTGEAETVVLYLEWGVYRIGIAAV